MEENNQIIIDIGFDTFITQLKTLQKQYELNTAALRQMREEGEENSETYIRLEQETKVLRQEIGGVEKTIQNEIKIQKANTDSLVQMRAQLSNLNKQYDSMDGMARMSEAGVALQQKIRALSAEIQGLEDNTGRWQRNVGNYKSALKDMKDATEAAGLSSRGLDRIMKGLSTNPWMSIVTLLVTILVKLRDRLKDNEKMTAALGKTMSSLQPVFNWFNKIIGKIADVLSNVLDWALQKVIESVGWLGRQLQKIGKLFGKDWGGGLIEFSSNMQHTAETTTEAAEATETFATAVSNVKTEVKEANEELEKFPSLIDQMLAKFLEQEKAAKAAAQRLEDLKRMYHELGLEMNDSSKLITEGLRVQMPAVEELADTANKKVRDFKEALTNNAKEIDSIANSVGGMFSTLSGIYSDIAKDETKSEEERAKAAKNAKSWAALQIAANSGVAVAKGVAGAMEAEPWPAKIAALASIMAAVLSAIGQAKALASQTFETGGVIGGFSGASMGRDNTVISARKGEMVLNAEQQQKLFAIANGNANNSMAAALAAALQSMPAPVMDYEEFTQFATRVAGYNENSKLK